MSPSSSYNEKVKSTLLLVFIFYHSLHLAKNVSQHGPIGTLKRLRDRLCHYAVKLVRMTPPGKALIEQEKQKILSSMLPKEPEDSLQISCLPDEPIEGIDGILERYKELDISVASQLSGVVYQWNDRIDSIAVKAFKEFLHSNPLHSDLFNATVRMESDIIRMGMKLFNGPQNSVGFLTSGGTESIMLSVKAHRDWAFFERGIESPEIILPTTAHVAFEKAAQCFKISVVKAPVNVDGIADGSGLAHLITPNTIMVVASVPCFPYGTADGVTAMAKLASSRNIGLHLDICLGSFWVPMMRPDLGAHFGTVGVTAISCDLHKVPLGIFM